ncbi:GrpB-like predicted nucleotidyltransferase (UPF0157 family) [Arthrobacter pigmenti]|uniref:GrpB-like predicted nucleotidyltransferase (UPF0157 family) n=1 Tax=Arthrobacter pigmenti TaxID=271432 RepID=A0A846RUD4_9MICC|nr:GrpB family protein [Arthrobacter pigmenti]NJC23255.1 GrpB-like predicted nucleotidyltransferase (UPF0157 family) [Arthrobacter pigmenti]
MPTHPLWRPYEQPDDDAIQAARVELNDPSRWKKPVVVSEYDPAWPVAFNKVADKVSAILGPRAAVIEHVGSTSVSELAAKPVIDVDLLVADSADEASYLPQLESGGFTLVIREPEWEEHRALKLQEPNTNLHVFSTDAIEPQRHVMFRNWLRTHPADRDAYASLKKKLAADGFEDVMHYNNAKAALIYDIYESIFIADPRHPHTPQAR